MISVSDGGGGVPEMMKPGEALPASLSPIKKLGASDELFNGRRQPATIAPDYRSGSSCVLLCSATGVGLFERCGLRCAYANAAALRFKLRWTYRMMWAAGARRAPKTRPCCRQTKNAPETSALARPASGSRRSSSSPILSPIRSVRKADGSVLLSTDSKRMHNQEQQTQHI